MDVLYGAGESQTIQLPAGIMWVIVSGEQQKAFHRTGMHSACAKLLNPLTCCPVGLFSSRFNPPPQRKSYKRSSKRDIKHYFPHSTIPSVSSSEHLNVRCHICKELFFSLSFFVRTLMRRVQKKIHLNDKVEGSMMGSDLGLSDAHSALPKYSPLVV